MTAPLVTYAVDGRVGIVSLNRPEKLNAIGADLKRTLFERFHEADRDPATAVVVLRAEGRSFCAGYDIAPNPDRAEDICRYLVAFAGAAYQNPKSIWPHHHMMLPGLIRSQIVKGLERPKKGR